MKRVKFESVIGSRKCNISYLLLMLGVFYVTFITFKFPALLEIASGFRTTNVVNVNDNANDNVNGGISYGVNDDLDVTKPAIISRYKDAIHMRFDGVNIGSNDDKHGKSIPNVIHFEDELRVGSKPLKPLRHPYGRITGNASSLRNMSLDLSVLEKMADEAWTLGSMAWEELESFDVGDVNVSSVVEGTPQMCSPWLSITGEELGKRDQVMSLPCGLIPGSSITVVGTPHYAHSEYVPQLARIRRGNPLVNVSQFSIELQGLKSVDGEAPPKIMHLNPRLRGDWSRRSVIEHNSCYRMQWGRAQRCDGAASVKDVDVLIDGFRRCEKWVLSDVVGPRESRTTSWLKRFIGRKLKPEITWPFPFVEGKMFILTIRAGGEGYHISVGGRHVTSFPYRTGFTLEDATGLAVQGDVDIHSIYATSLPTSHPSFSPQRVLEMSVKWKAQPLLSKPIKLFIGVLSATNHFAERMAVRKTWMQCPEIKSSIVAARFFVALNQRTEVNAVLKKEAAYFGDVVILPFLDRYELVVLKTIAICDYGVLNMTAAYIMKCDDDTFVRVDAVLKQIEDLPPEESLYLGNLNLMHRPLRYGKWAVTFEEWPESVYPPYANGPGYVISRDIAKFIVTEHINKRLRLFKMEDVSMGMWVQQFNSSRQVEYSHSWKFCQYGCVEGYYTAHYQSPRQMLCLWDKLARCCPQCCNFR